MSQNSLDEREFELINIIGADLGANQRELSRLMNLSLGMLNMLIRRLVSKGMIRIENLNQRKVQYILTPKGFAEKMQQSIRYTLKTIHSIDIIKEGIKKVVVDLYNKGERNFIVVGRSDFALLIEIILKDLGFYDQKIIYLDDLPETSSGVVLICRENLERGKYPFPKVINLLHELAKNNNFDNGNNYGKNGIGLAVNKDGGS